MKNAQNTKLITEFIRGTNSHFFFSSVHVHICMLTLIFEKFITFDFILF